MKNTNFHSNIEIHGKRSHRFTSHDGAKLFILVWFENFLQIFIRFVHFKNAFSLLMRWWCISNYRHTIKNSQYGWVFFSPSCFQFESIESCFRFNQLCNFRKTLSVFLLDTHKKRSWRKKKRNFTACKHLQLSST